MRLINWIRNRRHVARCPECDWTSKPRWSYIMASGDLMEHKVNAH